MNEYALYKGDEFLAVGTAREIAEQTGLHPDTIYYYGSPTYKKRSSNSENRKILVKLEDD